MSAVFSVATEHSRYGIVIEETDCILIHAQAPNSESVSLRPPPGGGPCLISGPKKDGLIGGGAYFKSHIFDEIHNNFPYFTIIPITKTERKREQKMVLYHQVTK